MLVRFDADARLLRRKAHHATGCREHSDELVWLSRKHRFAPRPALVGAGAKPPVVGGDPHWGWSVWGDGREPSRSAGRIPARSASLGLNVVPCARRLPTGLNLLPELHRPHPIDAAPNPGRVARTCGENRAIATSGMIEIAAPVMTLEDSSDCRTCAHSTRCELFGNARCLSLFVVGGEQMSRCVTAPPSRSRALAGRRLLPERVRLR